MCVHTHIFTCVCLYLSSTVLKELCNVFEKTKCKQFIWGTSLLQSFFSCTAREVFQVLSYQRLALPSNEWIEVLGFFFLPFDLRKTTLQNAMSLWNLYFIKRKVVFIITPSHKAPAAPRNNIQDSKVWALGKNLTLMFPYPHFLSSYYIWFISTPSAFLCRTGDFYWV